MSLFIPAPLFRTLPPFTFTPVTYTTAGDFTVAVPARAVTATFRGISGGAGGSALDGYVGGGGGGSWARKSFSVVGLTNIYIRIGAGGLAGVGDFAGYGMSTIVWGDGFNGSSMLFRAAGNVEQSGSGFPHLAGLSSQCIADLAFSGGQAVSVEGEGSEIPGSTSGAGAGNSLSVGGDGAFGPVTDSVPGGVDGDGTDPAGAGAPVTSGTPGAANLYGAGGAAKRADVGATLLATAGARGWGFLTMSAT